MVCQRADEGVRRQNFFQQRECHRTYHRTAQAPDAAENDHQQHLARVVPRQQFGVHHAVACRHQKAGQPCQGAGQHEGCQLVRIDRKAGRTHALLVDADAGQCRPEARAPDQRQQAIGPCQRSQYRIEPGPAIFHVERTEDRAYIHVDAVAAAADLGVVKDEVRHLRESQRDHDEVDAARAQAQRTDHQRVGRSRAHGERQQQRDRATLGARGQHGRVGTDAVERCMAQADQPGHADQQFQAQREDRQDHHLDDEVRQVGAHQRPEQGERECAKQR